MKLVIGLVGEKRAGKETFTDLLKEFLPAGTILVRMRFSDIISEILDILGIPKTRENMQRLPIALIREFGAGTITNAMKKRLTSAKMDLMIVDGVRRLTDAAMIKSIPESKLVYVTAGALVRYERAKNSNAKIGEESITFEKFLEQDQAEIEKEIPLIGAAADFGIQNEGSVEEFRRQVQKFYQLYISAGQ